MAERRKGGSGELEAIGGGGRCQGEAALTKRSAVPSLSLAGGKTPGAGEARGSGVEGSWMVGVQVGSWGWQKGPEINREGITMASSSWQGTFDPNCWEQGAVRSLRYKRID